MKLLLVLVALVALVAACAAPYGGKRVAGTPPSFCDRTFVVSPAFTEMERAGLARAVDRWNEIATEQFCLRPAAEGEVAENVEHGVFRIQYKGEYWKSLSESAGGLNILGVHFSGVDRIGIVDTLREDTFELTALHEFGHAHGLGHVPSPAIMHASIGTATDFTPNDLAECQRVGACRKEDEDG